MEEFGLGKYPGTAAVRLPLGKLTFIEGVPVRRVATNLATLPSLDTHINTDIEAAKRIVPVKMQFS